MTHIKATDAILTIEGHEGVQLLVKDFPWPSTVAVDPASPKGDYSVEMTYKIEPEDQTAFNEFVVLGAYRAFSGGKFETYMQQMLYRLWVQQLANACEKTPPQRGLGFFQHTGRRTYTPITAQFETPKNTKPSRSKLTDRWGRLK